MEEKAKTIVNEIYGNRADACMGAIYDEYVEVVAQALAREREAALEEACKALCSYCNDPAWPEASEHGFHTSPHTGHNFYCDATKVRDLKAVGVNQAAG